MAEREVDGLRQDGIPFCRQPVGVGLVQRRPFGFEVWQGAQCGFF